jgi:hypothetical protein
VQLEAISGSLTLRAVLGQCYLRATTKRSTPRGDRRRPALSRRRAPAVSSTYQCGNARGPPSACTEHSRLSPLPSDRLGQTLSRACGERLSTSDDRAVCGTGRSLRRERRRGSARRQGSRIQVQLGYESEQVLAELRIRCCRSPSSSERWPAGRCALRREGRARISVAVLQQRSMGANPSRAPAPTAARDVPGRDETRTDHSSPHSAGTTIRSVVR